MAGYLIVLSVSGDIAYFMTSIICKFSENDVVPPQAPKSRNASLNFHLKILKEKISIAMFSAFSVRTFGQYT